MARTSKRYSDEFKKLAVNEYCAFLDKGVDTISARKNISEKYNVNYDTLTDWCVQAGVIERLKKPPVHETKQEIKKEENNMTIEQLLGKKAKDGVTGFAGTITGYVKFLTGSDRIRLEGLDNVGRPVETWADTDRIFLLEDKPEEEPKAEQPKTEEK